MLCESCQLNCTSNSILPLGCNSPQFYILGDACKREEAESKVVFSSSTSEGQYLMSTLYSLGMNGDNTRMFKLVRCNADNLQDLNSCRSICSQYAKMDIWKTDPKIIITLGSEASKFLLGDKFSSISRNRGRIYEVDINGKSFKVLPTFSPTFILNNQNQSSNFLRDFNHAKSYVNGDLIDTSKKDLEYAKTYEEFKSYYDKFLINAKMPSYDLETNAHDPRSEQAKMVGFSLAPDTTTGIYVVRKSLEYEMPEEDWNKIVELSKNYIKSKTVLVHNCMYEIPFTLNEWGVDIKDFEDTLIKARMLRGGDLGSAGLKDQCIKNLGYPDWDTDLGEYKDAFNSLISKLKPLPSGRSRWDYEYLVNNGLNSLLEKYESESSLDSRCQSNYESLSKISGIVGKYYESNEDYDFIMNLIGKEISNLIDIDYNGPFSYGFVPMRVITKYGAMDAVGTQDLNVYLEGEIDRLSSELKIDLHRGYFYLKRQFIAGTKLELNGLYWNDDRANETEKWCITKCKDSLLNMIDSKFLDDYLLDKCSYIINDYIMNNELDYAMQVLGNFNLTRSGLKLSNGETVKKGDLLNKLSSVLGYDYAKANKDKFLKIIRDEAHKVEDVSNLKALFNPSSVTSDFKDLINSILVTDNIRLAHFMNKCEALVSEEEFDLYKYPASDRPLFQILIDCEKYNKEVEEFNTKLDDDKNDKDIIESINPDSDIESEDGEEVQPVKKVKLTNKDTFEKFINVFSSIQINSKELQKLANESLNYRLESLSEFNIVELSKYYIISGIGVDDIDNWTDRYKFLVNFRMYKKCYKMRSTYITGAKVGRGSVWMVDKNDLATGEILTRRKRKYDGTIGNNEACLMQASFAVASAETLRWRAGMHTIPAESEIKNIYTSRYKGGVIFAPDFSQMEIRVMAGAANCTPLIEAFKNGADIHMTNACKIFHKGPEEVTSSERRYAKMASFMILYGGSYQNFAQEYLNGDVQLGKFIYDSFYNAYPEVKQWIDERHKEMREKGRVTTPMSYYINISPEKFHGDESKALRAAQNYPIQSAGSAMAGNVLYEVLKYIEDNNFKSKCELFVHDSIEIDVHPDEFLRMANTIIPLMNKYPMEEFGIPTKADLVIGPSIGQEVEVSDIQVNESYTDGRFKLEGFERDILQLIDIWKEVYPVVEFDYVEEPKPYYESWSQFYIPKRAVHPYYGMYRSKAKVAVHLVTK